MMVGSWGSGAGGGSGGFGSVTMSPFVANHEWSAEGTPPIERTERPAVATFLQRFTVVGAGYFLP